MDWIWLVIAGFLSGICASMGLGGGFVLLLYLSFFTPLSQLSAQMMNLLFFLPIAGVSVFFHWKHQLIEKKIVWNAVWIGLLGVLAGNLASVWISEDLLRKLFGGLLLLVGFKEVFHAKSKQEKATKKEEN